jgi:Predicted glycosyltransferase
MVEQYPDQQYHSRIEDITSRSLTVAMPMSKGYPVHLNHGGQFYAKVFADGAAYKFKSTLLEKRLHPIPVWVVSQPTDITKIQQRAFVRVDARVPVRVVVRDETEDSLLLSLTTKDISGGGLRLISNQAINLGMRIILYIELPELGTIETPAEVVRVDKPDNDRDLYWIGVRYIKLPENLRSKIIKFVFQKQLEYRQKGL